jgi:hypothetical protein
VQGDFHYSSFEQVLNCFPSYHACFVPGRWIPDAGTWLEGRLIMPGEALARLALLTMEQLMFGVAGWPNRAMYLLQSR